MKALIPNAQMLKRKLNKNLIYFKYESLGSIWLIFKFYNGFNAIFGSYKRNNDKHRLYWSRIFDLGLKKNIIFNFLILDSFCCFVVGYLEDKCSVWNKKW